MAAVGTPETFSPGSYVTLIPIMNIAGFHHTYVLVTVHGGGAHLFGCGGGGNGVPIAT